MSSNRKRLNEKSGLRHNARRAIRSKAHQGGEATRMGGREAKPLLRPLLAATAQMSWTLSWSNPLKDSLSGCLTDRN